LNRTRKKLRRRNGHGSAFRAPGDAATLPELIRFLIDRTGYIKALETEGSPEAFSRIENLKELANAAHDAEARGETLAEFLDHAALASDTDQFDPDARVTLMTCTPPRASNSRSSFSPALRRASFPTRAPSTIPTSSKRSAASATSA
jgi:DNA helicase II / ATP-dependent DNA helicase PcrA